MTVVQDHDADGNLHWLLCIPPDGNCLFGALVHQLNGMTPANPLFNIYCGNLRQDAVDEIRENFVFYEEHLSRYAAELVSGDAPAAEKVETYLTNLETPGYWGGAECLSAISNRYKVKIQVYQGTGRVTFSPLGSPTEPPVLRVFYRGGNGTPNHYDSIICVRPRNLVKPIQAIPICGPAGPSILQSIIIQLTGAIPTETELNVFRWLVAEDADTRGPPFLAECGVGITERKNFTFRIRLGSIEGDAVTFVSLAALLRLRIYVRYPNGDSLREDPNEPLPDPPTLNEIESIVLSAKNGKSPGLDGIHSEFYKYADQQTLEDLHQLLCQIWRENEHPADWKKTVVVPIPKISSPTSVDDYRRICLSSTAYKIYAIWLLKKLQSYVGPLGVHQSAFLPERSTIDHLHVLQRVMQETWNQGDPLLLMSLDLKKAFDRVSLTSLPAILKGKGVPVRVINRVLECFQNEEQQVLWQGQLSRAVVRKRGIKQGCPLSPYIFNLIMEAVLESVEDEVPQLRLNQERFLSFPILLAFADDLMLVSKTLPDLEILLEKLVEYLDCVGLNLNENKCKQNIARYNSHNYRTWCELSHDKERFNMELQKIYEKDESDNSSWETDDE
ncbi:hypothetical protein pipiens_006646 [Culex pipiens pipiens]|uniref:Reverse transcriptase n=1 Tax=Culex pipiens pipiens TaxID=38569 RepID=A0ABD1DNP6_CULPP